MAKKEVRIPIYMACTNCQHRNYTTQQSKRNDPARMELNKFCNNCRKHTLHRETK